VAAVTDGTATGGRRTAPRDALVEELRELGLLALDRLDPLVGRLSEAVSDARVSDGAGPAAEHRCTSCPVCAALADLRGDRAEALTQIARYAVGLLAALRVALDQRETDEPEPAAPRRPDRVVQHIPVERVPPC
jgi:hypothetical protein